jgi:hypothetical protein
MSNVSVAQTGTFSKAWEIGYEDARNGGSIYDGYSYFIGPNLTEYREGFSAGRIISEKLGQPKRLAGGAPVNQPKAKSEADLMDDTLEAIRSGEMPIVQMTDELLDEIENALF